MKIGKELAKQAQRFKICQEWHDELKTLEDKRAMVQMYLKGIDFCLVNDYPSNDYIRRNFGDVINDFGVFLDNNIDLINVIKCVALGLCKGRVEINNFNVSEIFIKHGSALNIVAKDNAFVMVDAFDNTVVHIEAYNHAKVCVNRYGNANINQKVVDMAMVKIIDKHKKHQLWIIPKLAFLSLFLMQ
jgi:hypothetical protein